MEAQRNELLELAAKNGWKAVQLDNYDAQNWSKETWLLESVWSPFGACVYITFPIDFESQNREAWAIEISNEKPVYGKSGEYLLISLKQWKNEKDNFLKYLSEVRNQQKQNVKK